MFETGGALLIGARVGETIRKQMFDIHIFQSDRTLLIIGMMSSMIGSGIWQSLATFLKMPVSGTHAIVGSLIGFAMMTKASETIKWNVLAKIFVSWVCSPIISGIIGASLYALMRTIILHHPDDRRAHKRALFALPILYAITVGLNFLSIVLHFPLLGWTKMPRAFPYISSVMLALVTATLIECAVVPLIRERIQNEERIEENAKVAKIRRESFRASIKRSNNNKDDKSDRQKHFAYKFPRTYR